jgi:hypothetical protein
MVCFHDNNLSCFKLLHHVQYFCYFSWTYFGPHVCFHDFRTTLVFIKFSFIALHLFNKGKKRKKVKLCIGFIGKVAKIHMGSSHDFFNQTF